MVIGLVSGLVGGVLLGALAFSLIGGGKTKGIKAGVPSIAFAIREAKTLDDNTIAKIEDMGITLSDFSNAYESVQKTLPPQQLAAYKQQEGAFKAQVLENLINQNTVVAQALKEGFLNNPTNMDAMQNALNVALFQLYMANNAPTNEKAFVPSNPEIDQAYQQYGAQMRAQGMSAQQSREYIIMQLSQQKQQVWLANFVTKIREGYRVERNTPLIEKQGISTNPLDAINPPAAPAP